MTTSDTPHQAQPWQPRPGEIANADLRLEHLPEPRAPMQEVGSFALTYHGYNAFPDGLCGEIANARLHRSLDEVRACLFFEQRRFRHFGSGPEGEDLEYVWGLVEMVRGLLG